MKTIHRIAMVAACAAAGLGIAVGIAMTTLPDGVPVAERSAKMEATDVPLDTHAPVIGDERPCPATSPEPPAASPSFRPLKRETPLASSAPIERTTERRPNVPPRDERPSLVRKVSSSTNRPSWESRSRNLLREREPLESFQAASRCEPSPPPNRTQRKESFAADRREPLVPKAEDAPSRDHASGTSVRWAGLETEPHPALADQVTTYVYRPRYVSPAELQWLLQPMLTEQVGAVHVAPAETGNAVIIRDQPAALEQIDRVVKDLDAHPRQFTMQAMLLTVRLRSALEPGLDFELLRERKNIRPMTALSAGVASSPACVVESSNLKCAVVEGRVASLLDTLDTLGATRHTAVPQQTILDNGVAEIALSDLPSSPQIAKKLVETKRGADSQPLLQIRPMSSADGSIRAVILYQPQDDSKESGAAQASTIIVPDATTMVVGGILRRITTRMEEPPSMYDRLPTLRRSPRTKQEQTAYETLAVVTLHVVDPGETERQQLAPLAPSARQSIAERYAVASRRAAIAGDRGRALRFVEASLRFDCLDRDTVRLRNQLWSGQAISPEGVVQAAAQTSLAPDRQKRLPLSGLR